jgi:hypothetical protein
MSTQSVSLTERDLPEWLDPFPEPQTIPGGWSVDSIVPGYAQRAFEQVSESSEPQPAHNESSSNLHA